MIVGMRSRMLDWGRGQGDEDELIAKDLVGFES